MNTITSLGTNHDWSLNTHIMFALNKLNSDNKISCYEFNFQNKAFSIKRGTTIVGAMEYCLHKHYSEIYRENNAKEKFKFFRIIIS